MLAVVVLAITLLGTINVADAQAYQRVAYMSNWAQYRPGDGSFKPPAIDPTLTTHIIYAFAMINANFQIISYEWNDEGDGGLYQQLNDFKKTNPTMKTLLAVGGWNFGMAIPTAMMATAGTRATFINSVVAFLQVNNFDGLDLDFEYPGAPDRGGVAADKQNFASLCAEFKAAFAGKGLLITAAVGVGKATVDNGYDIPSISASLDFINLMTYDFHGAWEAFTGINSPLYQHSGETGDQAILNIDWAVNYWVGLGAPKNKLMVGLGTYGRCFTCASAANTGLAAPTTGPCTAGPYSREAGFLAYYEICDLCYNGGGQVTYSKEQESPYCVFGGLQWVGFDDPTSIFAKVQYIVKGGYLGWMTWVIDLDDFTGTHCGMGKYPLMRAMNDALAGNTLAPTTPYTGPSTIAPTTTTGNIGGSGFCAGKPDGLYADPDDCKYYYHCGNGNGARTVCGDPLLFNDIPMVCDWSYNLSLDRQKLCGVA